MHAPGDRRCAGLHLPLITHPKAGIKVMCHNQETNLDADALNPTGPFCSLDACVALVTI
jgi:hypothetical protein